MLVRFGLSCFLLILSSLAAAGQETPCFADKVVTTGNASASLSFKYRDNCATGMVVIEVEDSGRSQMLVQSFQRPVTEVWYQDMDGDGDLDLMLQTTHDQSAGKLMVFRNLNGRLLHQWLEEPDKALLNGYVKRDRVYVRWGKLVRLIRFRDGEKEAWRRVIYDFDNRSWQRE